MARPLEAMLAYSRLLLDALPTTPFPHAAPSARLAFHILRCHHFAAAPETDTANGREREQDTNIH